MAAYEISPLGPGGIIGLSPVVCPRCGESAVVHQEYVGRLREVLGMRTDGTLLIAMRIDTEHAPDESSERLWCRACCYRWPVPKDVEWRS